MYIYTGKLNWLQLAVNESITIVVPAGFALNDPICAYWQWTVTTQGQKKVNSCLSTVIDNVSKTGDKYQVDFTFGGSWSFNAIVASDFNTFTATMRNPKGDRSKPMALARQYGNPGQVPSTSVYTGKLNWAKNAQNELVTLVIPADVSNGAHVGLYYQWTVDGAGVKQKNHHTTSTFREVTALPKGDVKGTFDDKYYTFEVTVHDNQQATIRMTDPQGDEITTTLKQTDHRGLGTKKALIVRFSAGTDHGTPLVQDMLTKHLGFAQSDVEVYFLDLSLPPQKGAKDPDPPAVAAFKTKFTALLTSASAGHVRFVYIDDVTGNVVNGVWVGNTIRQNFKPGVNLTMVTSSCLFNGLLDPGLPTAGILLAACHETQFNIRAQKNNDDLVDPWIYAITAIIEKQVQRKGGVPSYDVLFNEAKRSVKKLFDGGQLDPKYKGPSSDETTPIPSAQSGDTSNQDPQLIFYDGYFDPGVERFLFPFEAANGGQARGDLTRYPDDELP